MSNFSFVVLIIIACTTISCLSLWRLFSYKKIIDKKNKRLIEHHLDIRFLSKIMRDSILITNTKIFSKKFMKDVKQYYNLEYIFVIESCDEITLNCSNIFEIKVVKKIKDSLDKIKDGLKKSIVVKNILYIENESYLLLIFAMIDLDHESFIVCVEKIPTLLDDYEIASLNNSLNVLRTRLIYS